MQGKKIPELQAFEADYQWAEDNKEHLLERYREQWVAIRNGRVFANAPDLTELLEKLTDPAHTCIVYITSESLEMVL